VAVTEVVSTEGNLRLTVGRHSKEGRTLDTRSKATTAGSRRTTTLPAAINPTSNRTSSNSKANTGLRRSSSIRRISLLRAASSLLRANTSTRLLDRSRRNNTDKPVTSSTDRPEPHRPDNTKHPEHRRRGNTPAALHRSIPTLVPPRLSSSTELLLQASSNTRARLPEATGSLLSSKRRTVVRRRRLEVTGRISRAVCLK